MTQVILGIDTSCYQTSCAVVDLDGHLLSEARNMLTVPENERGLRQSEAVFQHIKQLPEVLEACFTKLKQYKIVAVCASNQPVPQPGSYMPVFVAGASFGRAIAQTHQTSFYATSHQEGHFAAAGKGIKGLPDKYLAIHLSGGTTEILRVSTQGYLSLGKTLDISAGQLLDRLGVRMGFDFPAGASLEALAEGKKATGRYPAIVKNCSVSYSGVETEAIKDLESNTLSQAEIAAELFDVITRSLVKMIDEASKQTKVYDVLVTGGVASSRLLRKSLDVRLLKRVNRVKSSYGPPAYAGDNAVGVALIGRTKYILDKETNHGNRVKRKGTI
ncbi:MAG: O-sialoglycoprotein endopeptidase [Clostridiales bacterium]|nr:O-sialoglycoprotein endopeptidase [Clostridiales bacterium]